MTNLWTYLFNLFISVYKVCDRLIVFCGMLDEWPGLIYSHETFKMVEARIHRLDTWLPRHMSSASPGPLANSSPLKRTWHHLCHFEWFWWSNDNTTLGLIWLLKMTILRLLGSSDDKEKEKIGAVRPDAFRIRSTGRTDAMMFGAGGSRSQVSL